MTVVGTSDVLYGILKDREGYDHPIAAFKEFGIVNFHAAFLVKTTQAHGNIIIVVVKDLSGIDVSWTPEVAAVGAPFLHEIQGLNPSFIINDCTFPIGAEQVTTQLLDHGQEGNKIIRIAEIKPMVQRSEEHTSELQSRENLVCRLLL